MRVIQLTAKSGADGRLQLDVPNAAADTEYEVVLTAKPTPEELGWPKGYFENVIGSITDESFVRPPQPPLTPVEALDLS